jgi:hypothetical protein
VGSLLIESIADEAIVRMDAQEREASRFRELNDAFISALMTMRRLTIWPADFPACRSPLGSVGVISSAVCASSTVTTVGALIYPLCIRFGSLVRFRASWACTRASRRRCVSLRRVNEIS